MTNPIAPGQARTSLEKQIGQLGELRNAGTRAQEFREWRQATLTLIERMWPDQPTRAQRFRRIPFSPASAKADDRVAREAFERGCAEARRLLRLWLAEVSTHGVTQDADAPRLAEAVRATLVELKPRRKPAPRSAAKPARKRKPGLGEMLGFAGAVSPVEEEDEDDRATEASPAPEPDRSERLRLEAPGSARKEAPAGARAQAKPDKPGADALAMSIDNALERAEHEKRPGGGSEETREPSHRSHGPLASALVENRHMVSYVARAFIGMAADLEELGVPEGHIERVRLALLDLAHHLDCGSVTWSLIRDAVTLVMHYPALGRQAMPLLLPYLENAA